MNFGKALIKNLICLILGVIILSLGCTGILDEFWSGMGMALVLVGVLRLVQFFRYCKDDAYREKYETEMADERNSFIRNKAWAWAGYLFILIAGVAVIVLKVLGQDLVSQVISYMICVMLILHWGSYLVLRKKY